MGLHGTVKASYLALGDAVANNRLLDYKWFVEQEANTWTDWVSLPVRERLWLWKHGFTSPCGVLYDFETHDPGAYVSERQRYRLYEAVNAPHRYLLDDKLSQYWMLADFPEHRPTAFGFVDRGRVHGVAGTEFDGDPTPVADWLPATLAEQSKLVLKQLRGLGGNEVVVCEYDDGGYLLDGEQVSEEQLCETVAGLSGYIATEHVTQHGYADDLYPHATNTIRLLTVWDDEAGELFTPAAIHRIGTDRSRPVDNYSRGGLTVELDLETGELGQATKKPTDGTLPWCEAHPDTGARIEGVTVPEWEDVVSAVEGIARRNTNTPIIGWDVLLDEDGDPVVIEANTGTDLDLLQVHRPLLADDRVAAVASRHLPSVEAPEIH